MLGMINSKFKMQKSKLQFKSEAGFTLIDVIVSLGIIVLLFGGIFLAYMSITDLINNLEVRSAASSVLNDQVEIIRNLAYSNVGVVGGVPGGLIASQQNITHGDLNFVIKTTVRNIDDPFDGTLGGSPNDTAPADYKLVELEASCPTCRKFVPLLLTTTVAPKNLESASTDGSLFLNVFDANGQPVSGATVRVQNASVTPAVDLTDQTNLNGILQLVGVPTSTQAYSISVTKPGFSTDKTYPMGDALNPNPVKPHATVAAQTVTTLSFAIDGLSMLNVESVGSRCEPKANREFSLTGTKLIGTAPDVLKFTTSSQTDAQGGINLAGIEWDNYSFSLTGAGDDLLGTIPFSTVAVNPSSTFNFKFVVQPASPRALLLKVVDGTNGNAIQGASVLMTRVGYSSTQVTGRANTIFSDWSSNNYNSQSGGIDTEGSPGNLRLVYDGSTYVTSTPNWLISNTIDFASASTTIYSIHWNPDTQPIETGYESLNFQLASNNDDMTWNFIGPDGTAGSYYTLNDSVVLSNHSGNRYLRYKVFLSTIDNTATPRLEDVSFSFSGICVPLAQTLFSGLGLGTYDLTVTAPGFAQTTSSVSVATNFQEVEIQMLP